MTRDSDPQFRIGGISTMVYHQDVCAQCGEEHPESLFGLRHGSGRSCPNVLMGAFPMLTHPEPSRASAAVHRALGSEREMTPSMTPFAPKPQLSRKPGRLAFSWPMPMPIETDEFL
jgi:hypothetical protein